jgi:hypothetical protein
MSIEQTREQVLWMALRQALLMAVDAIERYLGMAHRTAEVKARERKIERIGNG